MVIQKIVKIFKKLHIPNWLVLILVLCFILRIPSFFEPFSYGDEMIYLTLGEAIRRGVTLYKSIHDNKPPLLYFLAAIAGNVFWFRVILAAWASATIVVFWKLTQKIFPKGLLRQQVATIFFAVFTTIPLFEGQIANAENFMLLPTISAFLLALTLKRTVKNIFIIGVFFSFATLFKVPAVFDVPALVVYWFATSKLDKKNLINLGKNTLFLAAGFLTPIGLTFVWYFIRGTFSEYFIAAFAQNVGYLSSWRPEDVSKSFITRNLPLILRGSIVMGGVGILYLYRKKLSKSFILATVWALTSLFAATLSERPYPHYLLQAVPSISLLFAILADAKVKEQVYTIVPILLFVFVPVYYKYYEYSSVSYYKRFLEFASGRTSRQEYFERFDGNVNRNYKIASFIVESSNPNEKIFVWGDSPPIYALSRRFPPMKFVATYHILDFSSYSETIKNLEKDNPTFIVVLPNSPSFTQLSSFLDEKYIKVGDFDAAEVWKVLTPHIKLN